jgi:hypothetical protein
VVLLLEVGVWVVKHAHMSVCVCCVYVGACLDADEGARGHKRMLGDILILSAGNAIYASSGSYYASSLSLQ